MALSSSTCLSSAIARKTCRRSPSGTRLSTTRSTWIGSLRPTNESIWSSKSRSDWVIRALWNWFWGNVCPSMSIRSSRWPEGCLRGSVAPIHWTTTAVTYEIVSSIPKASEVIEDPETLALMAASGQDMNSFDGESYIEKYTKGVSAVESILALDRLRQEVAVKELLARKGKFNASANSKESYMRKTVSVPNMAQMAFISPTIGGSSTKLEKSDSFIDLSYITNTAYEGFDRIRQRVSSALPSSRLSSSGTSHSHRTDRRSDQTSECVHSSVQSVDTERTDASAQELCRRYC